VLKKHGKTLTANAQRFEDSGKLSGSVSSDPAGIGFIGLNYIGSNKVIALSDTGVEARKPSLLTIKTEDYMLSRRLFLYTAEKPSNPNVFKFIEFAVGSAAQPVVASTGLVNLDVTPIASDPNDARNQSTRWRELTRGAIEIPTRFRFRTGGDDLDTRANRDIGRIVGVLSQPQYQNKKVILIGFADSSGSPSANVTLSRSRAEIVRRELAPEGLAFSQVVGLGAEAFVAPNDTPENKEKNRRVEVWLK
jgi:phosphate transport system substrate-binding protein